MQKGKEVKVNFERGFKKLCVAEEKYGFFQSVYNGIPLWLYGRDRALNIISGITSYEGQTVSSQKINFFNLFVRIFYFLFNFFKLFDNDIVVFTNERHLERDLKTGKYYNPFAELVIDINKNPKKVLIFEFPIPMTRKYRETGYDRYLTIDILLILRQFFSPFSFLYHKVTQKIFEAKLISSGLFNEPEIKDILKRCARSLYSIKCYGIFLKIVRLLNPRAKLIYSCMGGFDKFPGVVEIQPALIIDFQSVYIYPDTPEIKNYLIDKKMLVFSEQTKRLLVENFYREKNIEIIDNPKIKYYFLKNIGDNFFKIKHPKNRIVIVGNWGGSLQKTMKKAVLNIEKNKEKFDDWDIIMVLHPTEKNIYKTFNLKKIKVYENHEVSLWGMLSEAVCTIDITSTVIKESSYFGCFNIILKDEDFDDQRDFIKALAEEYPFKEIVGPEDLVSWFDKNNDKIKKHIIEKNKIMQKNYKYFLNN